MIVDLSVSFSSIYFFDLAEFYSAIFGGSYLNIF